MLQGIKDYVKCVYANKVTLCGYSGLMFLGLAEVASKFEPSLKQNSALNVTEYFVCLVSSGTLGSTWLGLHTFSTYRRTRRHMEKFGKLNPDFKEKADKFYCGRVGANLAIKEAGLEARL